MDIYFACPSKGIHYILLLLFYNSRFLRIYNVKPPANETRCIETTKISGAASPVLGAGSLPSTACVVSGAVVVGASVVGAAVVSSSVVGSSVVSSSVVGSSALGSSVVGSSVVGSSVVESVIYFISEIVTYTFISLLSFPVVS